jgi:hypothetical protein
MPGSEDWRDIPTQALAQGQRNDEAQAWAQAQYQSLAQSWADLQPQTLGGGSAPPFRPARPPTRRR